ncbi:tetratricopeptide repeat protein [Rhodovulum sp. DZ06]|uniref:tetratricopeptide repeat protein n=1 Tax=Rhodovulum sp. DZ06 TaxID=3425126 RepID=UPI003D334C1E
MHADDAGLDLALNDAAAAEAWRECHRGFLAHSAAAGPALARALEAAPGFALGHAAQGFFLLLLGRAALLPAVDAALGKAKAAQADGGGDARSAQLIAALADYRAGRMRRSAARLEAALRARPDDSLFFKLSHALRFLLGDAAGMRAGAELALGQAAPDHAHRGYLLGCASFAAEETGDYARAERLGRKGVEIAPDDAWGLHAVAHCMDMTGRAEDGVRWLARRARNWSHCNNFGYHVWWHLALFHLDRGAWRPALELYDRRVRPERTDDWRDIANAASLLLRLEMEGVPVGARWEELADLSAGHVSDGLVIFADLHYLAALGAAGRDEAARALTDRIASDAGLLEHDQHEACALAGLPAAEGLCAFRDGAFDRAHAQLSQALPQLWRVGGSHAQRDVFERLAIEAALRAGRLREALSALDARAARRGARDGYDARRRAAIAARRAGRFDDEALRPEAAAPGGAAGGAAGGATGGARGGARAARGVLAVH